MVLASSEQERRSIGAHSGAIDRRIICGPGRIPDGFVVSVGGLGIENEGEGRSQVPLLGDIPILGELFGTREKTSSQTRFYVFLRASVMRSATFDDLKYASGRELSAAKVDDGFPRLEPRIIR